MTDKKSYLSGNEDNRSRKAVVIQKANKDVIIDYRRRSRLENQREDLLSQFFGPEKARLELEKHHRPSQHISDSIDSIIKNVKVDDMAKISQLVKEWERLVGESIATYARPIAIKDKTLSIEVDHSSGIYTLDTFYKDDILKKVQTVCPRTILSLRFVPTGRRAPKKNPFKK